MQHASLAFSRALSTASKHTRRLQNRKKKCSFKEDNLIILHKKAMFRLTVEVYMRTDTVQALFTLTNRGFRHCDCSEGHQHTRFCQVFQSKLSELVASSQNLKTPQAPAQTKWIIREKICNSRPQNQSWETQGYL